MTRITIRIGRAVLPAVLALGSALSCDGSDTAAAVWRDVLRRCAAAETLGNDVLYLGPTNDVGAGAVWRRQGGGYALVWRLADGITSAGDQARVINQGVSAQCSGVSTTSSKLGVNVVLQSQVAPIQGQVANDLSRARSVTVRIQGFRWEQVVEGPFVQALLALPPDSPYRRSLDGGALVAGKVLRIVGLHAELEFTREDVASLGLQAKYSGPIQGSAGLSGTWRGQTTLALDAGADFYIAAELYNFSAEGFAGGDSHLAREALPAGATAIPAGNP